MISPQLGQADLRNFLIVFIHRYPDGLACVQIGTCSQSLRYPLPFALIACGFLRRPPHIFIFRQARSPRRALNVREPGLDKPGSPQVICSCHDILKALLTYPAEPDTSGH